MCTVTFLPTADGGYWLGCNRDERPTRAPAEGPAVHAGAAGRFAAPRDPDGGGTWIAAHEQGVTWCLLNGAPGTAAAGGEASPPSRGLLVWALAEAGTGDGAASWLERRRAAGRLREEPFRLLVAAPGRDGQQARLTRLAWDGDRVQYETGTGLHLEVSHGMDLEGARVRRRESLEEVRAATVDEDLARTLSCWHASHFAEGPELSPCLHLPQARTVSFTQVRCTPEALELRYHPDAPCQSGTEVRVHLTRGG